MIPPRSAVEAVAKTTDGAESPSVVNRVSMMVPFPYPLATIEWGWNHKSEESKRACSRWRFRMAAADDEPEAAERVSLLALAVRDKSLW